MGDVLDTVGGIVTDPGLPETIQLAMRMRALAVAEGGPADTSPGVGLSKINGPLRLYVEARESKWMIPAAIAAVVGLPFLLGLNIGKRRRAP